MFLFYGRPLAGLGTEEAVTVRFPPRELAGGGGPAGEKKEGAEANLWVGLAWLDRRWPKEGPPREQAAGVGSVCGGGSSAMMWRGGRAWELHWDDT